MSSVSSISSSLSNILTSYYTNSTSATEETSETVDDTTTDSTEESETLDQEEVNAIYLSISQGLVNTLSSISGTTTSSDDNSNGLSGLYDAIEMQQNSQTIADALAKYYTGTSEETEDSTETDSGIDTTA